MSSSTNSQVFTKFLNVCMYMNVLLGNGAVCLVNLQKTVNPHSVLSTRINQRQMWHIDFSVKKVLRVHNTRYIINLSLKSHLQCNVTFTITFFISLCRKLSKLKYILTCLLLCMNEYFLPLPPIRKGNEREREREREKNDKPFCRVYPIYELHLCSWKIRLTIIIQWWTNNKHAQKIILARCCSLQKLGNTV